MTRIIYWSILFWVMLCTKAISFESANKCLPPNGERITLISTIQSDISNLKKDQSPLLNKYVWVEAVVTVSKQGKQLPNGGYDSGYKGFWLQEQKKDFDQNINTSEGLFVFHSKHKVKSGDLVLIQAKVAEFNQVTQLQNIKTLIHCSSNNKVEATTIKLPVQNLLKLESVEGMLIKLNPLVISDFYGTGYGLSNYGQMVLSSKIQFYPTELKSMELIEFENTLAGYKLDRIILDDGSYQTKPKYIPYPDSHGLSIDNPIHIGMKVESILGVKHGYKSHSIIIPSIAPSFGKTRLPRITESKSPRIAVMNVKNFFNGEGENKEFPTKRGAKNKKEFVVQKQKIVNALLQADADIIGLLEIENDGSDIQSAIYELTESLNEQLPSNRQYKFSGIKPTALNSDAITQVFLYRPSTVKLKSEFSWLDLNDSTNTRKIRPALLQSFEIEGEVISLILAHFKSRRGKCNEDVEMAKVEGGCYSLRLESAKKINRYIESLDGAVILLGDLNAYSSELALKELEFAGLINGKNTKVYNQAQSFSYSFNGMLGNLDHVFFNALAQSKIISISDWHINSIYPHLFSKRLSGAGSEQNAIRSSDHDVLLIELRSNLNDK